MTCQTVRPRWLSWEYKQRADDRAAKASIMSLLTPCFCSLLLRLLDSTPSVTFRPDRTLFLDSTSCSSWSFSPFLRPDSLPLALRRLSLFYLLTTLSLFHSNLRSFRRTTVLLLFSSSFRFTFASLLLRPRSILFRSVLSRSPEQGSLRCRNENLREILIPLCQLHSRSSRAWNRRRSYTPRDPLPPHRPPRDNS